LQLAGFVAVTLVLLALTACSNDEKQIEPVKFQTGNGSLTVPAEGMSDVALSLTSDDVSFFGRANIDETTQTLELSLRSQASDVWLSLLLLNVRTTRIYVLDSQTEGSVTVLLGEICDGAMGDLLSPSCRWYSSDFYQENCYAAIETNDGAIIEGHVKCDALGANCPAGTGARGSTGACLDGERYSPIAFTATFRLQQPVSVLP
jgi:hypothetical protein